ncbi:medium-chain acyl-CoA ligase ACSF2, mitochondrial isoform X1 [Toxorhynchites rutilus septentrionalis]|uniref:medium-chain acyl-CoA ligase ACSF2, mitochondrial isoform X1 n=1 Tax=Toxorhynchites rutilus septentrionalis TaxID=329112 RepID=UPI00247B2709|nr:medium-chain acyl-CoA ligase ACSF2, mitochondrial isoform X1 [Toxorhynchites rutilus septentrionalis]
MLRLFAWKHFPGSTLRSFHTSRAIFSSNAAQPLASLAQEQRQSYIHHIGKHPLVYRNVGQHLRLAAEKYPNNEAIVSCHENIRLTYSEVLEKVDRLAASFYQLGLQKGDRIGIWAPNGTQFYLSALAAARAGLISVGINPAFQTPEAEYSLNKVGIKALIAAEKHRTQNYYEMLTRIIPELQTDRTGQLRSKKVPSLQTVIFDNDSGPSLPGTISFKDLYNLATEQDLSLIESIQTKISPDSGTNLQFTSGTTGKPKAALMSHYGFVNNGIHIAKRNEFDLKQHRICLQVPLFHAYAMVIGVMAAITYGTTLVLPGAGYRPFESLEAIIKEKCTVIYGTPTMYVDLVNQIRQSKIQLPSVDLAVTGGATCSPKLFMDIQEALGVRQVKTVFGMTEASAVLFQSLHDDSKENVLGTVGHLTDHYEAKVVDGDGNVVPFGAPGELWVRGYGTMLGYWEDEIRTKETIDVDKWLKTGDQFVLREDGYGQIVGRLKEVIIRGGENIFPKEIEDFLNTHPAILETHCVAVLDERMGEEVCAFVRLKDPAHTVDMQGIGEFCRGKIAHFKIPKYLRVLEEFPKTTSGKVQKFRLQEMFKNESKEKLFYF